MRYNRQNLAYKKDVYNNVNHRYSNLRVIKSKPINILGLAPFQAVMLLLFLVVMVSCLIYSNVKLDKIGREIVKYQESYDNMISEKIRLELAMESKISLKHIEEKAQENGLRPVQDYQIEYVSFKTKDKIELANNKSNIYKLVENFLNVILSYIK